MGHDLGRRDNTHPTELESAVIRHRPRDTKQRDVGRSAQEKQGPMTGSRRLGFRPEE